MGTRGRHRPNGMRTREKGGGKNLRRRTRCNVFCTCTVTLPLAVSHCTSMRCIRAKRRAKHSRYFLFRPSTTNWQFPSNSSPNAFTSHRLLDHIAPNSAPGAQSASNKLESEHRKHTVVTTMNSFNKFSSLLLYSAGFSAGVSDGNSVIPSQLHRVLML
ncbi:hypothetical protein BJV77DRAFT_683160 [Russula vinacea]|nr:hypothetical protein BJV77DRAFT_683160 [Russula vinacea]